MRSINRAIAYTLAILIAVTAQAEWSWVITEISPAAGSGFPAAASGPVQVGATADGTGYRANLWRGSTESWVNLHPAGAYRSEALGVSDDQIVGFVQEVVATGPCAVYWDLATLTRFSLHPPWASSSRAHDADRDVQVGEVSSAGTTHAGMWTGFWSSWVDLHPDGEQVSRAFAVKDGQQVGITIRAHNRDRAALWHGTAESWVDLHPSTATESIATCTTGVRQAGWVTLANGQERASLWSDTAASWVDLHPTGAFVSEIHAAYGNFQVGEARFADGHAHAVLWQGTADSAIDLNPEGFTYTHAYGISFDDGNLYVTGWGLRPGSGFVTLIWTLTNSQLGDLNCDGILTVSDIGPFILAVIDPAGYVASYPDCDLQNADLNADGAITVSDIGGFVSLLAN